MTTNMLRCIEITDVSFLMCINVIIPLPTWVIVLVFLCLLWVLLPDEIEIWL